MAYTKLPFENGTTPLNKDLFDHLQNGIADVDERLAEIGKQPSGSVELDASLTDETKAAQAKAVGDKINALSLRLVSVEVTDPTLTQETKAANAKAVGDEFKKYATKTYVDSAVANAGGGGGSSIGTYSAGLAYTLKDNGEYEVSGIGTCTDTHIVIPSIINSVRVTSIGENAFLNCSQLVSVTIPDGITEILESAFKGCGNMTELNLSSTISVIGKNAFYSCDKLEKVVIPEGVTTIKTQAFPYCYQLASVTIPKSVTTIEKNAFIYSYRNNLTFYCEAESKPDGWEEEWNYVDGLYPVVWGAALDFASVNEKLANVEVEVDTTLTKEGKAADAKAVGTKFGSFASKEWVTNAIENAGVSGGGGDVDVCISINGYIVSLADVIEEEYHVKATINAQVVQTLPNTLTPSQVTDGGTIYIYVVDSTGVAYCDIGYGAMTLGMIAFEATSYDKGWIDGVEDITEDGIYCSHATPKRITVIEVFYDFATSKAKFLPGDMEKMQANFATSVLKMKFKMNETILEDGGYVLHPCSGGYGQYVYCATYLYGGQIHYETGVFEYDESVPGKWRFTFDSLMTPK